MVTILELMSGIQINSSALIKLGLAFIFGGLLGLERELKNKPVGFKTCVILSVTSCLLTIVSIESAMYYADRLMNIRTDPMRLAAQIISGVGFLGAGVILHRNNEYITGLTTAAIIWGAAGIGITLGAGFYFLSGLSTILFLLAVKCSHIFSKWGKLKYKPRKINASITILHKEHVESLLNDVKSDFFYVNKFTITDKKKSMVQMDFEIILDQDSNIHHLYLYLAEIDYIKSISLC